MAATLELKYFNTFWLKKLKNVVGNTPSAPTVPYNNVPRAYTGVPAEDWYIEESRIRGGYNNTTVDFGVKAYIVEDSAINQNRFNTLIYSGIFNSRTGVNNTNQFSVGEDITRSADPANGSIQKLYAEDTNLIIFQENKVSRALIDKDAIYSAEGNALTTSSNLVIGQIIAYAGEYGISQDPFSFAVYGYRKYFTDRKRNCVLRLSRDGITEISSYGMHDFFRDKLSNTSVSRIVGAWDIHSKNYILSIQDNSISQQIGENGPATPGPGNDIAVTLNGSIGDIQPGDQIFKWTLAGQIVGEFYGTVVSITNYGSPGVPAIVVCNIVTQIPAFGVIVFQRKPYITASFDESVLGWTSFLGFKPRFMVSNGSNFFSFSTYALLSPSGGNASGIIFQHYTTPYGLFYNFSSKSSVTLVLNSNPSVVKNFKTLNYEGSPNWTLSSLEASSGDTVFPVNPFLQVTSLSGLESDLFSNSFKRKENKYFANLLNNSSVTQGEVSRSSISVVNGTFGGQSTGVKGFYSTVKLETPGNQIFQRELFSVSSNITESSY
tara:strand:+ start:975 stop:2618 length:1644 start_codon:yes stop_codon:yes gene_type:complete